MEVSREIPRSRVNSSAGSAYRERKTPAPVNTDTGGYSNRPVDQPLPVQLGKLGGGRVAKIER